MARPKTEFPPAAAIRALADESGRLTLRVTPGARTEAIALGKGHMLIKVRTTPEGGRANTRVLELLAQALGVPASRLQMLRGATGRDKVVQINLQSPTVRIRPESLR